MQPGLVDSRTQPGRVSIGIKLGSRTDHRQGKSTSPNFHLPTWS